MGYYSMSTRANFMIGTTSLFALAACAPSESPGRSFAPSGLPKNLSARWMTFRQSPSNLHIAVSGYTLDDILVGRVEAQFDIERYPELSARPETSRRILVLKTNRPCSTSVCISASWYRSQGGDGTITQDANGAYHLPDGSIWTSTDVQYAGTNNSGPLEGYIYHGSNASQWFAGANNARNPETMVHYQANQDQWYADNTDTGC
jgi:hypothetical protein